MISIAAFGTVMAFLYAEASQASEGVFTRPIVIREDGILIPPIYLNAIRKDKGLITPDSIESIEVKRYRSRSTSVSFSEVIRWRDAPLEFIIILRNGKRRRSQERPPETILEAVDVMRKAWNIKVIDPGNGSGITERIIDGVLVTYNK